MESGIKRVKTSVPVIIVEDHNDVLYHLYRAIGSKKLPFQDGVMVHFDSHPDLMIPRDFDASKIYDKEYVLSSLSIENWILPAVYAKHFTTIAWIKPPWATQLSEGIHNFKIGHHQATKEIKVTCPEPYFVSELAWSPESELEHVCDVTMEVNDLVNVAGGETGLHLKEDTNDSGTKDSSNMVAMDTVPKEEIFVPKAAESVLSDLFRERLEACPYVLDIDLDFYSTRNPFLALFTEQQFALLRELFHYKHPDCDSDEALREATSIRRRQLSELRRILGTEEEGDCIRDLQPATQRSVRSHAADRLLATFPGGRAPDPALLVDAGCTCDDCDLPHHVTPRDGVRHLVDITGNFLRSLPAAPALISLARSSRDDYCPPEDVDFIQGLVLEMLEQVYGSLDVKLDYDSSEEQDQAKEQRDCLPSSSSSQI